MKFNQKYLEKTLEKKDETSKIIKEIPENCRK